MKKLIKMSMLSLALGFVVLACDNGKKEQDASKEATEQNEHAEHDESDGHDHGYETAMNAYQCPMKCEEDKTYAEEGSCPVCKMDLKKVEVASNDATKEEGGVE